MTTFDSIYIDLLTTIVSKGEKEISKRNGHETTAVPGLTFSIDLQKEGFPLLTLRKIPLKVFVAEQMWFISGKRKPAQFLRDHTKVWDSFTNPGDVVTVAYGYRWRKHFGRDQLELLIDLLKKDPSSRHGVVVTWDPSSDGLGDAIRKNIPCPFTFTVTIIGGRLHLHNIVRSNDMILGFPHDVAGFALLQMILAQEIGVIPGMYTHTISNAHIWDNNYEAASELIERKSEHENIFLTLPDNSFARAEELDETLLLDICEKLKSQYHPLPQIKGLEVVI